MPLPSRLPIPEPSHPGASQGGTPLRRSTHSHTTGHAHGGRSGAPRDGHHEGERRGPQSAPVPLPCQPLVSQGSGRCAMEPGQRHPAAQGGWPLSVGQELCQFLILSPRQGSTFACHVLLRRSCVADARAKRTGVSDSHAGHAQRASVVTAQADQASNPTRSGRSDDAAARQAVLTLRAAGDGASGVRGTCMAQGARRTAKHGPARAMEVLDEARVMDLARVQRRAERLQKLRRVPDTVSKVMATVRLVVVRRRIARRIARSS